LLICVTRPVFSTKYFAVSYFYPCTGDDTCAWQQLIDLQQSTGKIGYGMINPNSGPGTASDSQYIDLVSRANSANLPLVAYVRTNYGNQPIDTVKSEVDKYYDWYPGISGIFFDETATNCNLVTSYYLEIFNYVKSKQANAVVVINPGTGVPECYIQAADIIVTFESTLSAYGSYTAESWNANYPASRFWHIIYDVPQSSLDTTYEKSQNNYAGYVFITDDGGSNPYDQNPSYLTDELALL